MTDRQRDLAWLDRRGQRAGRAVRQVAAQVDTGAMFDRVRDARRRWVLPLVAATATVAVVAIAVLVAVQPSVTVGGLDPVSGDRHAPAGLDDDAWPPRQGTVGPDGWVEVPRDVVPTLADPQDLAVVGGAFVLATEGGHEGARVWASADGFAWVPVPGVRADAGERLFVGQAGRSLVVATGRGAVFAGDVSGVAEVADLGPVGGLAGGPRGAVAITSTSSGGHGVLATSDGRSWQPVEGLERPLRSVAWDGTRFVGVTPGPDVFLVQAERPAGPWTLHPGSASLPAGSWGVEPTEPGFALVPRAVGDQGLDPILAWTAEGRWTAPTLPGGGPVVVDDLTNLGDDGLVAMGTDASRRELDADRLYRLDTAGADWDASVVETSTAFGPTAVLRDAHAVSDGTTAMVAFARRRAGQGDGLTLWIHRPVEATEGETWWCPPATVAVAEDAAIGNVALVSSRLSTVGEVRDWQGERIGDPTDEIPDVNADPQSWLEPLEADQPAIVCLFRGEFPAPGPGQFASFITTPGEAPRAYQVMPGQLPARDRHGPDGSVPLHDESESGPGDWAPPATVVVPDVTGLTEAEARARLTDVGVGVIEFSHATDDPDEVGRVVAQSPDPGEHPMSLPAGATTDEFEVVIQVGWTPDDVEG